MDRKSIIGIVIAIAVFVWAQHMAQQDQQRIRQAAPPAAGETASPAPTATAPRQEAQPAPKPEEMPKPAFVIATKTLKTDTAEYTFSNFGGGIASLKLEHHQGAEPGTKMVLNNQSTLPIGTLATKPDVPEDQEYQISVEGNDRVIATKTLPSGVEVKKVYTLNTGTSNDYKIGLEVTFTNPGDKEIFQPDYFLSIGASAPLHSNDYATYIGFDWYNGSSNSFINSMWFNAGKIPLIGIQTSPAKTSYSEAPGNVTWAGVRDQYFTTMLLPEDNGKGVWARPIDVKLDSAALKGVEGFLGMPGFKLDAGQSITKKFTIYSGPADYRQLKALDRDAVEMMNLDRWWITRTVGMLLLRGMDWLNGFTHSFALAIVLLTLIVRGALWHIQGRANKSMKRMQQIMPFQKEIQEKYKDDPVKMNQEMGKLWKEYGVHPLSGCLPVLIQFPIFIGFYSMLGTAVELRNQGFWWVHDLARPDTVAHIAGLPINVLPLMMAATTIWQMSLTPKAGDPAQQKMTMLMPIIILLFTYNFASALALYYTVSNILSVIQFYTLRNQPVPQLVKVGTANKKKRR